MSTNKILIDVLEEIEELSAILNTHDDTGDVDPDKFVREAAIAAALAYCNSKVSEVDRGDYKEGDFQSQMRRIDDMINEYYTKDSYSVVRTHMDLFIANLTSQLIMAISDQTQTPIFSKLKEDLSIVFKVLDGKNEDNLNGVSSSS